MNPSPGQHGAYVPAEQMLSTLQELTVTLAKTNVRLDTVIANQERTDAKVDDHKRELDAVKAKLYSMSAIIGLVVTFGTNWVMGKF